MPYLYRHIRLDKNQPFYIGVGLKDDGRFSRSRAKYGRNKIWEEITKKSQYVVEIMMTDLSYDEVMRKEKEFIAFYGRICNDTGILSNLSLGGDGVLGLHGPLNGNYGKKDWKRRPVLQIPLHGKCFFRYETLTQAAQETGLHKGNIATACSHFKRITYKGYIWEYEENVSKEWIIEYSQKGIVQPFNRILPKEAYVTVELYNKRLKSLTRKSSSAWNEKYKIANYAFANVSN